MSCELLERRSGTLTRYPRLTIVIGTRGSVQIPTEPESIGSGDFGAVHHHRRIGSDTPVVSVFRSSTYTASFGPDDNVPDMSAKSDAADAIAS